MPGAHIFVNAIFPVQEKAVKEKPVFAEIENFNEKLKELCDKKADSVYRQFGSYV